MMEERFKPHPKIAGLYTVEGILGVRLATQNMIKGTSVYGERLFQTEFGELREFSFKRSKVAASILQNMTIDNLKRNSKVLYLGASSGTTVSHISDIVTEGIVFAIEFAPIPMRDLLNLSIRRENIIPLHRDARYPEEYTELVDCVDFVFCDVAQPNQAELFVRNLNAFLLEGEGLIAIKSKSISQTKSPEQIFREQSRILESKDFTVSKSVSIDRYHKDHKVFRVIPTSS